jgi:hypothetical protein
MQKEGFVTGKGKKAVKEPEKPHLKVSMKDFLKRQAQ